MKTILFYLFVCNIPLLGIAQTRISGHVESITDGKALPGANVLVEGSHTGIITDDKGNFTLSAPNGKVKLKVSYIGYIPQQITLELPIPQRLIIKLDSDSKVLEEVIVSTGYEQLPKERATGSFSMVDNELLNRSLGTNVINRLENVAAGLVFNRNPGSALNSIGIRGQSTIYSNDQPLIVVDNFPYEGDIANINPNDVESISILKDAAAASIWGAKAGNGVIVITTKKGRGQGSSVSINSNISIGQKPDIFYRPIMSSSDFVDIEKKLFGRGYYQSMENSTYNAPLSPVVELLIAERDGMITAAQANEQIEALKRNDIRDDYLKYLYRSSVNQQYAINLSGGAGKQRYYFSAGYDHNRQTLVGDSYKRLTMNLSHTFSLLKDKLEVSPAIYFTNGQISQGSLGQINMTDYQPIYPYAKLADESGTPLAIVKGYRTSFVNQAVTSGLVPWDYKPLEELSRSDNSSTTNEYRLNLNLKYHFSKELKAEIYYQGQKTDLNSNNNRSEQSYFTRDLINNFSQKSQDGSLTYMVPIGNILDVTNGKVNSQNLRAQLVYNKAWIANHSVSVLSGAEIRNVSNLQMLSRFYGYDPEHATGKPVDYITAFTNYSYPLSSGTIPFVDSQTDLTDRFLSYYFNGAYTFKSRYTFSASSRLDRSNLFGVKTNQKGVPLYSAGLSWAISGEDFYKIQWLPYLKLRATFGYNGNINKTVTAYTTARYYASAAQTRLPYAVIRNPPYPELRWERVKIMNLALDFESRNRRLAATIEFFKKNGLDLIGDSPYPPSTGIASFRGNVANMSGQGIDIELSTLNVNRKVKWRQVFLLSYARDKVSDYQVLGSAINYLQSTRVPMNGKPLYALYTLKWGGLDPATGAPRGYLGNELSTDYNRILQASLPSDLIVHAVRPLVYGSLRNTVSAGPVSLSANISYRLGYYFQKESVRYSDVLSANGSHGDFGLRWQNPGDEVFTQVPSMPETPLANRDNVYLYSDLLALKGDHIRLVDVRLSFELPGKPFNARLFDKGQLYLYASNIGLLWTANRHGIDPDYQSGPLPLTLAAGLKIDL